MIILGLVLQLAAIYIVFRKVRHRCLSHVGFISVLMFALFHGIPEIFWIVKPEHMVFRRIMLPGTAHEEWVLLAGFAIFGYAVSYVLSLSSNNERSRNRDKFPSRISFETRVPHWVLMLIPILFMTLNLNVTQSVERKLSTDVYLETYWIANTTGQLLLYFVAIAFYRIAENGNTKTIIYVIIAQAFVTALIGSRSNILVTFIALISNLARYTPLKLKSSHIILSGIVILFGVLALTAARSTVGRTYLSGDLDNRITGLSQGTTAMLNRGVSDAELWNIFTSLDANLYPSLIRQLFRSGVTPVGPGPILVAFILIIPAFLWPGKLKLPLMYRNEKEYINTTLSLFKTDYLPSLLSIFYAAFGGLGMILLMCAFGFLIAQVDKFIHQKMTLFRLLLGTTMVFCAVFTSGFTGYVLELRTMLVVYMTLIIVNVVEDIFVGKSTLEKVRQ